MKQLKYILFFVFLIIALSGMAQGVKIIAPIIPNDPTDTYPTHVDSLGFGGFMSFTTLQSRNAISDQRRKVGMLVYVSETDSLYQLVGDIKNSNWVGFKLNTSGSAVGLSWKGSLGTAPVNPSTNWAYYDTLKNTSYVWDGDSWEIIAQDGFNGVTTLSTIPSLPAPPASPTIGQTYIDSNTGIVYVWDGTAWQVVTFGLKWQGSLASSPPGPVENWAYYNTTDRVSYIYNSRDLVWDTLASIGVQGIKGDKGDKGDVGPQGPAGNGTFNFLGSYATEPIGSHATGDAYYNTVERSTYLWDGNAWVVMMRSINWQGNLAAAPLDPKENWAYFSLPDRTSYIWNALNAVWDTLAVSGIEGKPGNSSINYLGIFPTAPPGSTFAVGDSYYNSTDKITYIWDGDSWEIMTQSMRWVGSFDAAPASPLEYWAYYNRTENVSYIYSGSQWDTLSSGVTSGGSGLSPFNGNRPITASVFTGKNPGTNDISAWLQALFFPSTGPGASLSLSGTATTLEMMSAGADLSATLNWSATRSATTEALTSVVVNGASQSVSATSPAAGSSINGAFGVTFARNASKTYNMQVQTQDGQTANASASVNFSWKRYYGFVENEGKDDAVAIGLPTVNDILLLNAGFASSRLFTPSATPAGSKTRFVIAYPLAWDTGARIFDGPGNNEYTDAFTRREITVFTNSSGGTTPYVVYTSVNNYTGNISFQVK